MKRTLLALSVLALPACSLQKRSSDAEPTAFIRSTHANASGKIARLPFDHSWADASVDFSRYHNIVISPVTTRYLHKEEWKDSYSGFIPSEAAYIREVTALGGRFTTALKKEFASSASALHSTADRSKPGTLVLEVAVTEVIFGRPAGYVGSFAVPGGSLANAAAASPIVAFEARVRDARSDKVVATASDRRGTKLKIIDFNQLTYTKANDEICREWAAQLMQACNKHLFPTVKRSYFSAF